MSYTKNSFKSKGVTLIEVIIVMSIVAFLVLLGIAVLRSQLLKGNDARRKADMKRIQLAIEEYEKDHNCYPTADLLTCNPGDGLKPYIDKIPCDPVTGQSYAYDPQDGVCADWYRLYGYLDNLSDSDITGTSIGPGRLYNYNVGSPDAPDGYITEEGGYYGCKGGVCLPVIGRNECSPTYTSSNCRGRCGSPSNPQNECSQ